MILRKPVFQRSEGDGNGAPAPQPQPQSAPQQQQGAAPQQQQGGFDPVMAEYYREQGYKQGIAEVKGQWEAADSERIKAQEAAERDQVVSTLNFSDEMKEKTKHMSLDDLKLMQEFSASATPVKDEAPVDAGGGIAPVSRMHAQEGLENMSDSQIISKAAMEYLNGGN